MRKNCISSKKAQSSLSPLTQGLLAVGLVAIFSALFFTVVAVTDAAPFPLSRAAYFGGMVEHVLAALALLTAGSFLVERVVRSLHSDKEN